jgi:ribosome-associated protein
MEPPQPDNRIPLAPGVSIAPSDVQVSFSRSSGPGGQAVNKLSTKAELRVALATIDGLDEAAIARLRRLAGQRLTSEDVIIIQADSNRSQRRNREEAMDRLREMVLRAATPPKRRKKTRPSRGAVERRLQHKREQSEKKQRRQPPM